MLFLVAIVASVILVAVASLEFYQRRFSRFHKLCNGFHGPPRIPILGNAHYLLNLPPENVVKVLESFTHIYGDKCRVWLGNECHVLTTNIEDYKAIMSNVQFAEKSTDYDVMRPWLRDGLLISKGQKWHSRRRILTPAFHFKFLEGLVDVFNRHSLSLALDHFARFLDKGPVSLEDMIKRCTLDIICESAMGVSLNAQTNIDSQYVQAVKTISMIIHKRMADIVYRIGWTYKFTKLARDEKKALRILHGFTDKIIKERRMELLMAQEQQQSDGSNKEDDDIGGKRKMALLDILLKSEIDGKPLSNLDIREEVDTFMFEGHDTISSAITFFFYMMAKNPECQRKCFDEIYAIFGDDRGNPVAYENLNRLPYVELCIKETLRLFPSVPFIGRKITQECEINGKMYPAGTNIAICPLFIGRKEEIFPKANDFIPERFDVIFSADKVNPYAYIPFSAGPRNCIGQKFAMLEMKSLAVNVLRNFELEYAGDPKEEPKLIGELILRTKDPLMYYIKQRRYS